MRQNVTSFYERSQSAESASQANMDKFYDTNAPGITLNDNSMSVLGIISSFSSYPQAVSQGFLEQSLC